MTVVPGLEANGVRALGQHSGAASQAAANLPWAAGVAAEDTRGPAGSVNGQTLEPVLLTL